MANINVRRIDDEIVDKLRARASEHGVSMEEEVRQIIEQAVSSPAKLGDMALKYFGSEHGIELELANHKPHQAIPFS